MQIQQSRQNSLGVVTQVPPQVLTELLVGQQVEAVVVKAALAAQIASLRIGETLIEIKTPIPLKQGQTVQLELTQSGGKPELRLVTANDVKPVTSRPGSAPLAPITLVPGQQVTLEVIKLLSENRLLLGSAPSSTTSGHSVNTAPLQFDIDITKLVKTFTIGEKVVVEIATVKPLTVALKAESVSRDSQVIDKIKQLLPQLDPKPSLATINNALKSVSLPSTLQGEVERLVRHVLDKQQINQPQALKQAIQSSGIFTEKTLLKHPQFVGADFKANLLKIASVVEMALDNKLKTFSPAVVQTTETVQKTVSPLQALSANSLGKSQTTKPSQASTSQQSQISSRLVAKEQSPTTQLRSPFALQTSSTLRADSVLGQIKQEGGVNQTRAVTLPATSMSSEAPGAKLTLLATILQALGSYNATPSTVSVLNTSSLRTPLPTALPSLLESVLTPSQASALAQALNKSITSDPLRVGGQLDLLLLQGLLKEVESLHARIQLNQLSMLKEPESPTAPVASWLIDLPVKDKQGIEFLQLQIDQFKTRHDTEDEDDIWSVQLRLDTQNLGPMQATVTMQGDDIKIVMRAERADSALLLEHYVSWLDDALAALGISVSHISCGCGAVAKPSLAEQYLAETSNLVDVTV